MQNNQRILSISGVLALLVGGLMPGVAAQALTPMIRPVSLALTIPFNGRAAEQEPQPSPASQEVQQAPEQTAAKTTEFSGTIVKTGSDFVLRDAAGQVYQLDTPSKAEPFKNKLVKVTGKLEENAKLIHVETIDPVTPAPTH
jgi:uncharacterized protein YdeI (BOF family)